MADLRRVGSPAAIRSLTPDELVDAAAEIRSYLVEQVARGGGHLGPNLGIVELTLALHRVFDSPTDPIIFDVGHQAYVHKIVTGRAEQFETLRTRKGLSGYPSRAESEHDWVENSHASTSLAYADGLAKAFALRGERRRTVVAVIGDGALTGGMAWEALNNIAAARHNPVVIVLNDNGRSYAPTTGGMAEKLAGIRLRPGYERMLRRVKSTLPNAPVVGRPLYAALHAAKSAVKDWFLPQTLFSDLGLKYVGPIDGHDITAVETALRRAKGFRGPVLVHCITRKGEGYLPAVNDDAELMHSPPAFDPVTGKALPVAGPSWTETFSGELVRIGAQRPDVVAITAAMRGPAGLDAFASAFPDRVFDVGIAEQHAVTSAAGMAMGGLHPVVAVYSTFLNRAFDQLMMDCALHRLPVTFVLDRAGVTGPDGPSHHGMWDLSLAGIVPGLRVAAPRDARTLAEELGEAVDTADGPTLLRWPKGQLPEPVAALRRIDGVDILAEPSDPAASLVLLVAVGAFGGLAVDVARRLADQGIAVTVVDPRWVLPVPEILVELAGGHRLVVTVEDGGRSGGVGAAVADSLAPHGVPVRVIALPQEFLPAGSRRELLDEYGLTAQAVARGVTEMVAALGNGHLGESADSPAATSLVPDATATD